MLEAEELAETVETLRAIGNLDRWLARIGDQFPRLGGLKPRSASSRASPTPIEGCLDSRGKVLDTASRRLSAIRREIGQVEERIQETLRRMLRSPEIRRILRYPELHDGRPPLRPADRQGAPGRDPGLGPPHQRQQRDGLHRAAGDRRAVGPALLPPRRARPRRSAASSDGSVPRSARWPSRCSARSRPSPSST